jgi:2-phospho-L-lactate/phosphoenolpyruvate guanylyltransferase
VRAAAIVPVKRFAEAKRRLATGVDDRRRRALAAAMLEDVLAAIGESRSVKRTIVVSGDPRAQEIAAAASAEVVPDPTDEAHSVAARAGIARAEAEAADCVVLLPGDCPLLEGRDLDRLLTGVPARYVGIVPDRHGSGTNALVLSPPGVLEPAFGEGSRDRHVAAARAAEVPFEVEEVPSLALDVDTPADLVALTREIESRPGRAQRTAKALGL